MNKCILTLMDQNQSHQQNSENSHMFHLKKKSYHSMPIDWIFFSFLRFVEMPYLVSLISFTPYPRIAFFFAFICPICVNCFFKVFIGG